MTTNLATAEALCEFIKAKIGDHTLNKSTGGGWLDTYSKILPLLTDEERNNILNVSIELLSRKFQNKFGLSMKGTSLNVHLVRINSMLENFKRFIDSPQTYHGPNTAQKKSSPSKDKKVKKSEPKQQADIEHTPFPIQNEVYRVYLPNGKDFILIPINITDTEWDFAKLQIDGFVKFKSKSNNN
jgi:hypothetical protein